MKPPFLIVLFLVSAVVSTLGLTVSQTKLGNIFLTTERVQIPISCSENEVSWSVTDYLGEIVKQGTLTPEGGSALIQPDLGRCGYFDLQITEKSNGNTLATAGTTFAVLTPINIANMADSPFGAQTHFAQYNDPEVLTALARAGIAHVRDEQYWSAIETQLGVYAYPTQFINYMRVLATQRISPLVTLDWSNSLYDHESGQFTAPHTENGRKGYANYGLNLLNHYGSQVKSVEIWNEYNAGTFIQGPATSNKPYYYYLMLKEVYESIKAAHPDVTVVAGATVPIAAGFLRDTFNHGAMPYLDAVSIHPYRSTPDGIDLEISELRELIRSYNNGQDKPIWATEFNLGADNVSGQFDEAPYLAQITTLMLIQKVQRIYYYLTVDDENFPYWGLVSSASDAKGKYTPHPSYVAYANVIRELYGATFKSRYPGTSPSTYGFKFQRGNDELSVLWSNQPVSVSLETSSSLVVTDIMGQETTLKPVKGAVELNLTKNVQYVKGSIDSVTEGANNLLADSVSGYSKTPGQNGWYYGYADIESTSAYDPSQFRQMTWGIWGNDSYRWLGTSTYHFASADQMHPSNAWAIRRWVSNIAGTVTLSGMASRGDGGDGVNIRIFVDGSEVYSRHLAPGQTIAYSVPDVVVNVGSKIDFTVNQGSESSLDVTQFTSLVTLQQARPN